MALQAVGMRCCLEVLSWEMAHSPPTPTLVPWPYSWIIGQRPPLTWGWTANVGIHAEADDRPVVQLGARREES